MITKRSISKRDPFSFKPTMNCSLNAKSQDKCRLKQLLSYSISGFVRATTVKIIIQTLTIFSVCCYVVYFCWNIVASPFETLKRLEMTRPYQEPLIWFRLAVNFLFCFDLFLSYQTSLYQIVQEDECNGKETDLNKCRLRWILQEIDNFAR